MMKNNKILLIGAGPMAIEYAKILIYLKYPFIVVGNKRTSAENFTKITKVPVVTGGINRWLITNKSIPNTAIVATPEETLGKVTLALLKFKVKNILVEKPGGLDWSEIDKIGKEAKRNNVKVYIAYNRRFYASVEKAKTIIEQDGGPTSLFFEFTEWSHIISKLKKPRVVKEWWFLHNSTHVIDMAFFMTGFPEKIVSYTKSHLKWHPSASVFTGAGLTKNKIPFSYIANWAAPGRWAIEIMTNKHRLIFKPLESLHIQNIGSVEIVEEKISNKYDLMFKPGLYAEVKSFLTNKKFLCTITEQVNNLSIYRKILNGIG